MIRAMKSIVEWQYLKPEEKRIITGIVKACIYFLRYLKIVYLNSFGFYCQTKV